MELLALHLSELTRRSRSVMVRHADTGLARGLEPGERVVVRDERGTHRTALVADVDRADADEEVGGIDGGIDDRTYRLELGIRLTVEEAAAQLAGATEDLPLLDLLSRLRTTPEREGLAEVVRLFG